MYNKLIVDMLDDLNNDNLNRLEIKMIILQKYESLTRETLDSFVKKNHDNLPKLENTKIIYLKSPASKENCEENDGIPECIFKIDKKKWIEIGKILKKHESYFRNVECDFSSGAHGCILCFDLIEMYDNTIEIFQDVAMPEKKFDKIANDYFIDFLEQYVNHKQLIKLS
jgi:hypothetical protein